ncbi:MAG: O-antigen ligase family protein [bacterium]|nr:O-antigen ligase family protein [bacterium]MDT8365614.1 O-antigen ligase family protein [bacterium]
MVKGRGVPVLLLIFVLVLRPHMAGGAYPFAQGLFLVPVLVGLALLLLSSLATKDIPEGYFPVLLLPWSLLLWSLITLFWAPDPGQGLREIIAFFGNLTVFFMTFLLIRKEKEFEIGSLPVLGLIVTPVLASAFYQRVFGLGKIRETLRHLETSGEDVVDLAQIVSQNRVFAGFLNPNMLAGFLAIGVCLTLDLLLTASDRRRFLFFTFLTVAQGAVLVLTGSIGGSMVAVVMAGGVLLVRRRFKLREMVLAGGVVVLITAGLLAIRGENFLSGPENSILQRGGYMAAGIRMALIHPVLGWGSGSSPGALMGFVAEGVRPVADPHNFLVRTWISWGLPGLLFLVAFLSLWLKSIVDFFRVKGVRMVPPGYAGFVFGSMAFLGHSLLDMDFFVPETALFGWCVLGAALGLAGANDKSAITGKAESHNGFTLTMGAVALVMVLPVFVFFQGESLAFRAGKAVAEGEFEEGAHLYKDARAMLPMNGRFALDEGRARYAAGETDLANELFRKADSLMRASPYPSWEIGRAAQTAGKWQGSIPPLETALLRYKTSPRIRIDLARAYLNLGDSGQSYRLLEEVRRMSMFDPQARDLADEILSRMDL